MGETLEEGLNALFGSGGRGAEKSNRAGFARYARVEPTVVGGGLPSPAPGGAPPSGSVSDLLREAQMHYDRAIAAQRAGNWAEYGREIEQLGTTIRALRAGNR